MVHIWNRVYPQQQAEIDIVAEVVTDSCALLRKRVNRFVSRQQEELL